MYNLHKKAQTKTHPWDGDIDDPRLKSIWFSLLFVALSFILIQSASAQRAFPMPDPVNVDLLNTEEQLSRLELQAANDYKEILLKFEFLIHNHLGYFSNYDNFEGVKFQNLLLKTLINIEKGIYCVDVDKLSEDLSSLTTSLKKEERTLKKDKSQRKLYKNVYTLRSDFEMIADIIDVEISENIVENEESLETIKVFLQAQREFEKQKEEYQVAMFKIQEQIDDELSHFLEYSESLNIVFDEVQMRELLKTEDLQKELDEILNFVFTIEMPEETMVIRVQSDSLGTQIKVPWVPAPPSPPDVPDVVRVPHDRSHDHNHDYSYSGKTSLSHRYIDTIIVRSKKTPIFINNQLGDIEIKGWDKNKVVAEYSYEVISDTHEDTEDFLESIELAMSSDKSGIYISSEFPNISNAKRQVVFSNMVLHVPKKNIVDITNSFGKIEVTNLHNNLKIKSKNSEVIVKNIVGTVSTYSKHGSVYLSKIKGDLDLSSKYSDIVIHDVISNIKIKNSYSPISVSGSRGKVFLENNGTIEINDHIGDVDIKNENGQTIVQALTGDLTLTGSNMPLYISAITGSIDVQNKNSIIELSKIKGESIVLNHNGIIKAQGIEGNIDFSNYGGDIHFIAEHRLLGNSIIRSDYGQINLVLPKHSNILLDASTEGGSIISSFQTKIIKDDFVSSTTIALGEKSDKLQVTGTNATIVIKESK